MNTINGKNIHDATSTFTFTVTAFDVLNGAMGDPMSCALARGMASGGAVLSARVGVTVAYLEFKRYVLRFGIRSEDSRRIRSFDNTQRFDAGAYTLVPPSIKRGVGTLGHNRKSGRSGKHVTRAAPIRHCMRMRGDE